jgi:hypothetical protein
MYHKLLKRKSSNGTHVQANPTRFETNHQDLGFARRSSEFFQSHAPLLDIHRAIESILLETLPLQYDLNKIQKGCELGEHDGAETGILFA